MLNKIKSIAITVVSFVCLSFIGATTSYDSSYVQISTVKYQGSSYNVIYMDRGGSGKRIKAKYFAAKDKYSGKTVPQRYHAWSKNKNIICASSGTYMNSFDGTASTTKTVGLTIDNGVVVNQEIKQNTMDGLVIVYATGGIVATDLKNKDLKVQGGNISGIPLDLRGNSLHRQSFLEWGKDNQVTVFQTHLLVYDNKLKISSSNSSSSSRERRFLAVGNDEDGNLIHCVIHSAANTTLYDGADRVLKFLNNFKDMSVVFMVNLDTGAQDVLKVFDENGYVMPKLKGQKTIDESVNLLVYYYE
ncbi:MAG: hypothetical protein GY827_09865 [Cytophagales bacterium]|nr:hypothetical protein [Cytophagales bacterium]